MLQNKTKQNKKRTKEQNNINNNNKNKQQQQQKGARDIGSTRPTCITYILKRQDIKHMKGTVFPECYN